MGHLSGCHCKHCRSTHHSSANTAQSRPFVPAYTVVGLDGTPGLTHVLTFQTRPDAPNDKLATHWPKSPEENLELLKVSGLTVASNATVCRGCGGE